MKPILLLSVICLTFMSCSAQSSSDLKVLDIVYREDARGNNLYCKVTPSKLEMNRMGLTEENRNLELSPSQWDVFVKALQQIDLPNLADLEPPSEGRATDRAATAQLIVKTTTGEYSSSLFDAGTPPEPLEEVIDLIFKILDEE